MRIVVADRTKHPLTRYGPNKLIGNDVDDRKELDEYGAIELFDRVWYERLEQLVRNADLYDSSEAVQRLTESQQKYFDHRQQHRDFRGERLNVELSRSWSPKQRRYQPTQFRRIFSSSDTHTGSKSAREHE